MVYQSQVYDIVLCHTLNSLTGVELRYSNIKFGHIRSRLSRITNIVYKRFHDFSISLHVIYRDYLVPHETCIAAVPQYFIKLSLTSEDQFTLRNYQTSVSLNASTSSHLHYTTQPYNGPIEDD
ncbi:hypothetical protein NPIL_580931 [Nephila pilipes]|uniref:Uncharacterized protein n=1 Tax=Nephila pilipes TaxID=299642 RepID=A0A8X6QHU3_NEPPI|nr:hypothetical protein NPIL_580931 [Nephila pilipes]